jgi:hypothetical protein
MSKNIIEIALKAGFINTSNGLESPFIEGEDLTDNLKLFASLLLAQPEQEPFKPDWANYRQGVADSKREPLSDKEIREGNESMLNATRETFIKGVRFAEVMHGITGVDDE